MSGLNDINDIPKAWRAALASMQVIAPDAVIAGGCLRDRDEGVKVKDIDIFVPCRYVDASEGKEIEAKMKADGWQDVRCLHDESYNGSRISRSIETRFPGCPPINVIVMPYNLVEFDFGICQIEFNGKRIYRTPDYVIDQKARQFRLIPKVGDAEFVRSLTRFFRIKEKYPQWKLNLGSRAEANGWASGGYVGTRARLASAESLWKATRVAIPDGHHPAVLYRHGQIMHAEVIDANTPISALSGRESGEYLMPRALATQITQTTTARSLGAGPGGTALVHIDKSAWHAARAMMIQYIEDLRRAQPLLK